MKANFNFSHFVSCLLVILLIHSISNISAQVNPTFVSIRAGASIPLGTYASKNIDNGCFTTSGYSISAEGAWFFTKKFGVGILATLNQHPVDVWALGQARVESNPFLEDDYIRSDPYTLKYVMAGFYFQQHFYKKFSFNAKAVAGFTEANTPFQIHEPTYFMVGPQYEVVTTSIDRKASWLTGAGLRYDLTPCYAIVLETEFFSTPYVFGFNNASGTRFDNRTITILNTTLGVRFNIFR